VCLGLFGGRHERTKRPQGSIGTADAPLPVIAETYLARRLISGLFRLLAAAAARSSATAAPAAVPAAILEEAAAEGALLPPLLATRGRTGAVDRGRLERPVVSCVQPDTPPAGLPATAVAARRAPSRLRAVTAPSTDASTAAVAEAAAGP